MHTRQIVAWVFAGAVMLGPATAAGQDGYPGKVVRVLNQPDIARLDKVIRNAGIREEK